MAGNHCFTSPHGRLNNNCQRSSAASPFSLQQGRTEGIIQEDCGRKYRPRVIPPGSRLSINQYKPGNDDAGYGSACSSDYSSESSSRSLPSSESVDSITEVYSLQRGVGSMRLYDYIPEDSEDYNIFEQPIIDNDASDYVPFAHPSGIKGVDEVDCRVQTDRFVYKTTPMPETLPQKDDGIGCDSPDICKDSKNNMPSENQCLSTESGFISGSSHISKEQNLLTDEGYSYSSEIPSDLELLESMPPICPPGYYAPRRNIKKETILSLFKRNKDGDSTLTLAIMHEDTTLSLAIIHMAPEIRYINQANCLRQTPAILAAINNMPRVLRHLMAAGARVDAIDDDGNTALHIACKSAHLDCVECLLTPLNILETAQNYKIPYQKIPQNTAIPNYDGYTCLHLAAEHYLAHRDLESLEIMRLLLTCGADVNLPERKSGKTVLHMAAEAGNKDLVTFLLHCTKLDIEARTYSGHSAVSLADGRGHRYIVCFLERYGADIDVIYDMESEASDDDADVDMVA